MTRPSSEIRVYSNQSNHTPKGQCRHHKDSHLMDIPTHILYSYHTSAKSKIILNCNHTLNSTRDLTGSDKMQYQTGAQASCKLSTDISQLVSVSFIKHQYVQRYVYNMVPGVDQKKTQRLCSRSFHMFVYAKILPAVKLAWHQVAETPPAPLPNNTFNNLFLHYKHLYRQPT